MSNFTMDCESWIGATLIDHDDHKLGKIEAIYYDEQTGQPQWMAVKSGLLGNRHDLVPVAGAMIGDEDIKTPYDKGQVGDAPRIDVDEDLRDDQVADLYRHYGLSFDDPAGGDIIVEREIVLPATDPNTQAADDMLVATGHESAVDAGAPVYETQAEQDMAVATGRAMPGRVA